MRCASFALALVAALTAGCAGKSNGAAKPGPSPAAKRAHPDWAAGEVHGAKYREFKAGASGAMQCTQCHGAQLQGNGDGVSCTSCHHLSVGGELRPAESTPAYSSAYEVTAACVGCHEEAASSLMETTHWTWSGPVSGKANLVNNFCVSVPSNEKRCDQCHAGYGGDPDASKPQKSARAYTAADSSIPLEHRVDCLACHSDPAAGYRKDPKDFGRPAKAVDLQKAAQSIIKTPTRENCGACHFYAGGGDNVKLMGSALANPSPAVDVHMAGGMACADCHADSGHRFKGAGVHAPSNPVRASCTDCHEAAPHSKVSQGATIDRHLDAIACQTCHVPTFSRAQFAKVDWDWSTAGDKTKGGGTGVVKKSVNDLGEEVASGGTQVTTYDFIKGDFRLQRNVKPAYAWYNGKMVHVTISQRMSLATETGRTSADADRITLAAPLGSADDPEAKIHPFKLMRGRQAVYVDGANSFVVAPNVFGPTGFWGVVQSAGYGYDPATRKYTAPATAVTTPKPLDSLWSAVFTKGAIAAGQLPGGAPVMSRYDGRNAGWDWRYTKMYMDLNHEVAPRGEALRCADCHSASRAIDWKQLGYSCANPASCPKRP